MYAIINTAKFEEFTKTNLITELNEVYPYTLEVLLDEEHPLIVQTFKESLLASLSEQFGEEPSEIDFKLTRQHPKMPVRPSATEIREALAKIENSGKEFNDSERLLWSLFRTANDLPSDTLLQLPVPFETEDREEAIIKEFHFACETMAQALQCYCDGTSKDENINDPSTWVFLNAVIESYQNTFQLSDEELRQTIDANGFKFAVKLLNNPSSLYIATKLLLKLLHISHLSDVQALDEHDLSIDGELKAHDDLYQSAMYKLKEQIARRTLAALLQHEESQHENPEEFSASTDTIMYCYHAAKTSAIESNCYAHRLASDVYKNVNQQMRDASLVPGKHYVTAEVTEQDLKEDGSGHRVVEVRYSSHLIFSAMHEANETPGTIIVWHTQERTSADEPWTTSSVSQFRNYNGEDTKLFSGPLAPAMLLTDVRIAALLEFVEKADPETDGETALLCFPHHTDELIDSEGALALELISTNGNKEFEMPELD